MKEGLAEIQRAIRFPGKGPSGGGWKNRIRWRPGHEHGKRHTCEKKTKGRRVAIPKPGGTGEGDCDNQTMNACKGRKKKKRGEQERLFLLGTKDHAGARDGQET